jgi:hypothetical protein
MVTEIEALGAKHAEQKERDKGAELDRFTPQHYIRMHTVPLGQWMVMDWAGLGQLWTKAPIKQLIEAIRAAGARLPPQNQPMLEKIIEALARGDQEKPVAEQTGDRGLFEAVAQIVALRRTTAPLAIDILERVVVPALHVGASKSFPPLDEDDIANLRRGVELFAFYVDVVPHKYPAADNGFLGSIPHERLSTPYVDRKNLEIGKGDWIIVDPTHFKDMVAELDPKTLLETYDEFVKYVAAQPSAPRRRDDGRMLAETVARALADFKANVTFALSQPGHVLVFRLLPPPG